MLRIQRFSVLYTLVIGLGIASGNAACSGCNKDKPADVAAAASAQPAANPAGLSFALNPGEQKKAESLIAAVDEKNWRFSPAESNKKTNARVFTFIAATSDKPAVIGAALNSMHTAYSAHAKSKVKPDADFDKVVSKHLGSEDPKIVARALRAARTALTGKEPSKELLSAVVALKDKHADGPGRYALIDALRVVSFDARNDALMSVFTESLDSKEPYVLSYTLQALYRSTRSIKDKAAVNAKVLQLAKHEDPGVRGRAIELLGSTGKGDPASLEVVLAALEDPHAYVRSEAAESSARLRHAPAIHSLMKLVDQAEPNSYQLEGFKNLDGSAAVLRHDGSAWGFVQDAAMTAIRSLSSGELKLDRIEPKSVAENLASNAKATQAWYQQNKASIPTK